MDAFSKYMDHIRAGNDLKERTKSFVAAELAKEIHEEAGAKISRRKTAFTLRRLRVAAMAAAACMMLAVGGYAYYETPVSYISLDINPSVELAVNAFNRVVETEGINEDGMALIADRSFDNMKIEDAVGELVREAARWGFIAEDGSTVVAVTAGAREDKMAAGIQARGENGVKLALQNGSMNAVVYSDHTDLKLRDQARASELSIGKYRLISILQEIDPAITIEDYRDARMTDIIMKADELLTEMDIEALVPGKFGDSISNITNAALRIRETNSYRWQYRNGGPDEEGSEAVQEEEQYRIQNQEQGVTQNQQQSGSGPDSGTGGNAGGGSGSGADAPDGSSGPETGNGAGGEGGQSGGNGQGSGK